MQSETHTIQKETHTTAGTIIERLFSVGAHFGFTRSRRHPTAAPFIFTNKQGTDIFDLEKTSELLDEAKKVCGEMGKSGKTILFVSTKEEIKKITETRALAMDMPFVVNRWVGGLLTNFSEIRKRIQRLNDLVSQGETGELERKYTKKERVVIGRELAKLQNNFGGISKMDRIPQLLIVVDPRHDAIAVSEANQLSIPVIGITSSDANLNLIKHPILVNDNLQSSVSLILDELIQAYNDGKAEYVVPPKRETQRQTTTA